MTVDKLASTRWLEIQFYQVCVDVIHIRNNIMDLMDFVDSLAFFGEFSAEKIKEIVQEVISSVRFRPSKEEYVILAYIFNINVRYITKKTGVNNRTLYNLLERERVDPRIYLPKLKTTQHEHIKPFLKALNNFKKVGVPN